MNKFYSFSFVWKAFGNRVWKVPGFNILGFKKINSYLHLTGFVPKRTVACLSYQKDDKKCKQRVACFSICLASQCQQYWISKCILKALNVCLDNLLFGLKIFLTPRQITGLILFYLTGDQQKYLNLHFFRRKLNIFATMFEISPNFGICGRITMYVYNVLEAFILLNIISGTKCMWYIWFLEAFHTEYFLVLKYNHSDDEEGFRTSLWVTVPCVIYWSIISELVTYCISLQDLQNFLTLMFSLICWQI